MSERAIPLRFGTGNHAAEGVLTADPAPAPETPLDYLLDERANRLCVWSGLARDLVIELVLPGARATSVLALLSDTLVGLDEVRLDLYSDEAHTTLAYSTGLVPLAEPLPVGTAFRAGIDAFGAALDDERPTVFMRWLPKPIVYRSARVVVRRAEFVGSDTLSLRHLVLGEKVQLEKNFAWGAALTYLAGPPAVRLASGRHALARPWRPSRRLELALPMMTPGDRQRVSRMERRLAGKPFLVSAFSGSVGWEFDDYAMLGMFETPNRYAHAFAGRHATAPVIVEV